MALRLSEVFGLSHREDWIVVIRDYLSEGGSPDARDERAGAPLLHVAFEQENLECLQYLLDSGADLNAQDANGWTLLHLAVDSDIDCAIQNDWPATMAGTRMLLRIGARDDIADAQGRLPRDIAQGYGPQGLACYEAAVRDARG